MNGVGKAAEELGQGAAVASAVQADDAAADGHTHETSCLNCGTRLVGPHCHACGQAAHVHRTLGAFLHDLLHGAFHFEGRVWHTVPLLVWHPGRLTREYIDGRRARYVSPIALFLFFVFLMFAVFHATEKHEETTPLVDNGRGAAHTVQQLESKVAETQRRRQEAAAKGGETASLDSQLAEEREALTTLRGLQSASSADHADDDAIDTKIPQLDHAIRKFKANPDLASYKIQTYAYKYSWALIPISVPFMWLLFPFSRRFHPYDHTVFVTYSLCFMALLVIAAMIAGAVGAQVVTALLFFVPPIHMYRQLRGAYGVGRISALIRTALLVIFASVALALFFVMIMAQISY